MTILPLQSQRKPQKRGQAGKLEPVSSLFTPKVLANFSPGLRFGNPGDKVAFRVIATLKGLRRRYAKRRPSQLLQSCDYKSCVVSQGCQSPTLGWN